MSSDEKDVEEIEDQSEEVKEEKKLGKPKRTHKMLSLAAELNESGEEWLCPAHSKTVLLCTILHIQCMEYNRKQDLTRYPTPRR